MSAPTSPSLAMRPRPSATPLVQPFDTPAFQPSSSSVSSAHQSPMSPRSESLPHAPATRSTPLYMPEELIASSSRRSFPSISTSASSSTPSSTSTSAFHQRPSVSTDISTAPTSPDPSLSTAQQPAVARRNWRRTANVPEYIHQRHATRLSVPGYEDDERNRWLSEDEGIGSSTISRRRRRRSWDRSGPDRGDPHSRPPPPPSSAVGLGNEGLGSAGTSDRNHSRRKSEDVARERNRTRESTKRDEHRSNKSGDQSYLLPASARQTRGSVRRTHSYEPSSASATPDPSAPIAAVTLAQPQSVGEQPPRIADLISPRSPVVMSHPVQMTPVGLRQEGEEINAVREASSLSVTKLAERSSIARRGSLGEMSSDDSMDQEGDRKEWEKNQAKKDTLGRLQKLLGCILCLPNASGGARSLHNPITLPCGHTLSATHLALPAYQLLGPSSPPTIDQSSVALAQQVRQLQQQRLNHWASLMCPIPSCKRYSPSASPGTLLAEIPEITLQLSGSHSAHSNPRVQHGELLASGVHYYPPQSQAITSPPAYDAEPSTMATETGEHSHPSEEDHHSPLQDVTVEKILHLVLNEQKKLDQPPQVRVKNKPKYPTAPTSHSLSASLERSHIDRPGSSNSSSADGRAHARARGHVDRPGPMPISSVGSSATSSDAEPAGAGSDDSLASQSLMPKRRRGDAVSGATSSESNVSPYEWEFQRELMGLLECDVCTMLLYEPVTTPCQHSFCAKCLSRSLDHSSRCPVCRQDLPSFAFFQDHAVNRVLLSVIKTVFPTEYVDRGAALDRDARDARLDTPIFVCTLAFPGMPTILHVFEPRYRLMIRRCIESSSPRFGMVLPSRPGQGSMSGVNEYGTMLEIQSVQMLPDGRSMVETVGTHRFQLLEKGSLDGYTVGRIERIDDIGPEEEAAREQEAVLQASAVREKFRRGHFEAAQAQARANGEGPCDLPTVQAAIALSIPSVLPGQPQAVPSPAAGDAIRTEDAAQTTEEYMTICRAFIEQLRSGSAPWLLQRLNSTYGSMPDDPSEFSYWMALVMPIDEYEKARLLPIRSPRLRLKLIAHWVESLRSSWWFSSGCVVAVMYQKAWSRRMRGRKAHYTRNPAARGAKR